MSSEERRRRSRARVLRRPGPAPRRRPATSPARSCVGMTTLKSCRTPAHPARLGRVRQRQPARTQAVTKRRRPSGPPERARLHRRHLQARLLELHVERDLFAPQARDQLDVPSPRRASLGCRPSRAASVAGRRRPRSVEQPGADRRQVGVDGRSFACHLRARTRSLSRYCHGTRPVRELWWHGASSDDHPQPALVRPAGRDRCRRGATRASASTRRRRRRAAPPCSSSSSPSTSAGRPWCASRRSRCTTRPMASNGPGGAAHAEHARDADGSARGSAPGATGAPSAPAIRRAGRRPGGRAPRARARPVRCRRSGPWPRWRSPRKTRSSWGPPSRSTASGAGWRRAGPRR